MPRRCILFCRRKQGGSFSKKIFRFRCDIMRGRLSCGPSNKIRLRRRRVEGNVIGLGTKAYCFLGGTGFQPVRPAEMPVPPGTLRHRNWGLILSQRHQDRRGQMHTRCVWVLMGVMLSISTPAVVDAVELTLEGEIPFLSDLLSRFEGE